MPIRQPTPPEPDGLRRYLPHAGIAAGLLIAGWALFFRASEEDRIRQKLEQLEDAVAVHGAENHLLRLARIKKAFSEIFDQGVVIRIPELTGVESGRNELVGLATNAVQLYERATVDLDGLHIVVEKTNTSAMASGEATLDAVRHGGEIARDTRTVALRFDKIEGDWRIVNISASPKQR